MSGRSWDKKFSHAATARNMVVSSCPSLGSVLPSLSSTLVSSLATTPGVGTGLAASSPRALITSFTWRKFDLELLVKIRSFSDHLRLNLVRFFELSDQPLSVFPGSLVIDIITMD